MAREFARYAFGDAKAVELTCVTSSNRIPFLDSNKIDVIAANMFYTDARAQQITFVPTTYIRAGAQMMSRTNGPSQVSDLAGKTVITVKGTIFPDWFAKCQPTTKVITFDTLSDAIAALKDGRGDGLVHDDAVLAGVIATNPGFKISTGKSIAPGYVAMGVRKGEDQLAAWSDEALNQEISQDFLWKSFQKYVTDPQVQKAFESSFPRPGNLLPKTSPDIDPGKAGC